MSIPDASQDVATILLDELTKVDPRNLTDLVNVDLDLNRRKSWGGFGDVYVGEYRGSNVCVKVLREVPVISTDWVGKFVRRLRREVKIWHDLRHDNVIVFLGWTLGRIGDKLRVALISEWAEGGNVKDFLRSNPLGDRPHLVRGACRGLAYLHSCSIVHGDIKPENILVLGANRNAQLCDFGLSSILDDFTTHAETSSVMSTPRYAAPELVGNVITRRNEGSDIWAFGCTAVEILTDQIPYKWASGPFQLSSAICKGPPYESYEWSNVDFFKFDKCISACFESHLELRPSAAKLSHLLELASDAPPPHPFEGPPHPSSIAPSRAPYPAPAPHASSSRAGSVHVVDPLQPPSIEPPPPQRKRPRYTRSRAGCLTCRRKKIKCDEVKPVCTRCDHAQRECTWPSEMQRKEIPRFRPSYSAEPDLRSYRAPSSSPPSYPSSSPPYPSSSPPSDAGSMVSGTYDDSIAGPSGNESGDDYGRMAGSGYLDLSYLPQSLSHLVGAYGNISLYPNQTNVYRTGQQRNLNPDVSGLQPLGIDHSSFSLPAPSAMRSESSPLPPDSAPSPEEAASAGYSSAGARTATGDRQWSNSLPMVNSMPDPIEPMFKTLKERELIRHYAGSSTELIMAVNTSAALNPVLATALPIVLSVPPRTNAPVEALRLSLLGVAAIHQSFLHSHSNSNRQLLEKSTVTNMRAAEKGAPLPSGLLGGEGEQDAAENLRLALLLRQNASKCLYFACQSLEGSLHDAALAASASIALIDIFAGGNDYESNLALAKQLIAIRGGPENIVATNTPARTSFGGGVIVSPARLALEIIAVYDVFGSLTTGEEPAYLGHGDVRWWLDGDDQNYHKYSVEKTFAMSRMCIHLVANVSSLLSRLSAVEGTESFTKIPPDPKNVPASALNLHTEATALLGRLEEEANSDAARAPRFVGIGSDEGTATGGTSGSLVGGGLGEDEIPLPPNASPDYPQTTAQRIEHGTQAHLLAFQIVLLRLVFHVDRHDRRVQSLANEIITRCHTSATSLQMPIDLTWPAIIAACELDVQKRGLVSEIFEGFRKKSCYDIDTAEQIVNRVWRRVDQNQPQANWKSVLEDDRMRVLLI